MSGDLNLRRKHRTIQLPPGIAAANDAHVADNAEWDELVAQHKKRMAVEASRKVLAAAKRAEKAAQLPRTTEPKAPKIAAPKVARAVSKRVSAAPPPAAAVTARQQKAPTVTAAKPAAPAPLDLSMFSIDPQIAAALGAVAAHFVAHIEHHQRQAAETERRQRDAERRSAQEAARQQQIVREREAWQRRISTLLQSAQAVHQRPRAGDRRSSSSIRLRQ
jgi:hypothetical protein